MQGRVRKVVRLVPWLVLSMAIGKSVNLWHGNSEDSEMKEMKGKDDLINIRMKRDLIEDDCAEDTKTMVAGSIACSRE